MADDPDLSSSRHSGDFAESAVLETLVPFGTDIDIETQLSEALAEVGEGSVLSGIKQRLQLYFDETVSVYVVLQTQYIEENILRSYLSRLAITLDVHITNSRSQAGIAGGEGSTGSGGPNKDLIFSNTVKEDDDPLIIVQGAEGQDDHDGTRSVLVVWKMDIALNRPRARITNPLVTFAATAHLRPAEHAPSDVRAEEYLPSGTPNALNLLESFASDPAFRTVKPRLSALRVSRVAPASPVARELLRPLKSGSQKDLPAIPAVGARVRYARLSNHSGNPTIIGSLDFDVMPFVDCEVRLDEVDLQLSGGTAEELKGTDDLKVPITCKARDNVTLLYRLVAVQDIDQRLQQTSNVRTLTISILATILVSDDCRPPIRMDWRSNVDFSAVLNSAFGGASQVLQRSRRPSSLPIASSTELAQADQAGSSAQMESDASRKDGPAPNDPVNSRPGPVSLGDLGLTITFTGPDGVSVGEPFRWDVFLVNRSDRPRKLALFVLSRRKGGDARKVCARPSSGASAVARHRQTASAVVDENVLYAMQRNALIEPAELVTLSTEVRVGPLPPSACHTTELRFLPLTTGVLHIEAIRVIDLATQQATDVRDLPCIVSRQRDPS